MEEVARPLIAWESFYVIVGSSGAALTGLQFVVMALVADGSKLSINRERRTGESPEIAAFGTPNVIHFCAVLLVSAILSAPWHGLSGVSFSLGACGVAGLGYGMLVVRRARRQTSYRPVFEDWLWHAVLPLIAYALLLLSAIALRNDPQRVLFIVGAMSLLLLFIGIHNAWDTVTYIAAGGLEVTRKKPKKR
jgi:Mn2+/Fe2+ NRAMP family transporter